MAAVLIFERFHPLPPTSNMRVIVSSLVLLSLLTACGYKGPLFLPKPKPEAPATAPAPAQDPKKTPKDGQ